MTAGAPATQLLAALAALRRALDRTGARYMLIGGLAVIARGVTRDTDDVDATVWAPTVSLDRLLEALAAEGIAGRIDDARQFAERAQVLLLRHQPSSTPMEISLAWLPFEEEALARAETLDLAGVSLPVATAEDLVIYKAVAWRDRDRADIERLLQLHGPTLDLGRVRALVREFADALEEPERVEEFELILRRTRAAPR